MRLAWENLPKVAKDPNDIEARGHMMASAAMGATAFQKGLGAMHALSHPIGAVFNTHHGMTNAIVMPAVLNYNRPAIEERIEALARYLNIEGGFDGFFAALMKLSEELGVPKKLSELGVTADRIPDLAAMAIEDPSCGGNPLPVTLEVATKLLEESV